MKNPDHARFAEWDAAYVVGALSPAERREYRGTSRRVRQVPRVP